MNIHIPFIPFFNISWEKRYPSELDITQSPLEAQSRLFRSGEYKISITLIIQPPCNLRAPWHQRNLPCLLYIVLWSHEETRTPPAEAYGTLSDRLCGTFCGADSFIYILEYQSLKYASSYFSQQSPCSIIFPRVCSSPRSLNHFISTVRIFRVLALCFRPIGPPRTISGR